jgi:hypothetical protein
MFNDPNIFFIWYGGLSMPPELYANLKGWADSNNNVHLVVSSEFLVKKNNATDVRFEYLYGVKRADTKAEAQALLADFKERYLSGANICLIDIDDSNTWPTQPEIQSETDDYVTRHFSDDLVEQIHNPHEGIPNLYLIKEFLLICYPYGAVDLSKISLLYIYGGFAFDLDICPYPLQSLLSVSCTHGFFLDLYTGGGAKNAAIMAARIRHPLFGVQIVINSMMIKLFQSSGMWELMENDGTLPSKTYSYIPYETIMMLTNFRFALICYGFEIDFFGCFQKDLSSMCLPDDKHQAILGGNVSDFIGKCPDCEGYIIYRDIKYRNPKLYLAFQVLELYFAFKTGNLFKVLAGFPETMHAEITQFISQNSLEKLYFMLANDKESPYINMVETFKSREEEKLNAVITLQAFVRFFAQKRDHVFKGGVKSPKNGGKCTLL